MPIFVSVPVADSVGFVPVAAFASVKAFTADAVAVRVTRALPFVSSILVPTRGLVRVLFVRVSVVARPTIVSAVFGNVKTIGDAGAGRLSVVVFVVPVIIWFAAFAAVTVVNRPVDAVDAPIEALFIVPPLMAGLVRVLFVRVSVVARPTRVSVDVGSVNVPVFTIVEITGLVRVLFVSVSVVARPTRVSVDVGSVNVPVFTIVEITGLVRVLFVRV
jgi:hypothetical protein